MQNFNIPYHLHKSRLDKAIAALTIEELTTEPSSRSSIQKDINNGNVKVNDVIILDSDFKVKENDSIEYMLTIPQPSTMQATCIPLDIVYEDEYLVVVNKQAGLTVHPGAGNYHNTLANALLYHFNSLSDIGGVERPGIVHRLDKDTSGLMVVAKTNQVHTILASQLADHTLIRKYKALIWGMMSPINGTIINNIVRDRQHRKKMTISKTGGREAVSHYKTEKVFRNGLMSLIECKLETGRTHQIRVQFNHAGHSIFGDQTYGHNSRKSNNCSESMKVLFLNFKRQALHSWYIGFVHPVTKNFLEFSIQLPDDIQNIINNIDRL